MAVASQSKPSMRAIKPKTRPMTRPAMTWAPKPVAQPGSPDFFGAASSSRCRPRAGAADVSGADIVPTFYKHVSGR